VGWVVTGKLVEFAILLVLLKLLTNVRARPGYGEYELAETALNHRCADSLRPAP
jgi:hypothetical protein